jgi:single-strand DNA-binding protein
VSRERTSDIQERAMFETALTVVGNLATGVDTHRLADGTVLAKFRVASTKRRYDRAEGGWTDGDNLYLDVRCKRDLAENASASLVKGDPVVVTGRLYTRTYEHDGRRRSVVTLEALSVAADLSRCRTVVTRTRRRSGSTPPASEQPADDHRGPAEATVAVAPGGAGDVVDEVLEPAGSAPGGEGR